jgi:hypothetical protein
MNGHEHAGCQGAHAEGITAPPVGFATKRLVFTNDPVFQGQAQNVGTAAGIYPQHPDTHTHTELVHRMPTVPPFVRQPHPLFQKVQFSNLKSFSGFGV